VRWKRERVRMRVVEVRRAMVGCAGLGTGRFGVAWRSCVPRAGCYSPWGLGPTWRRVYAK